MMSAISEVSPKTRKFIVLGIVVFALIGVLAYRAFAGGAVYYFEVSEVLAEGQEVVDKPIKIGGIVSTGSTSFDRSTNVTTFKIEEKERPGSTVPVVYEGVVPDNFREGIEVVVDGTLDTNGTFHATNILTKCPSKYEAAE